MHSGEPDPIFLAPRRPRKGPGKLARKWAVSGQAKHPGGAQRSQHPRQVAQAPAMGSRRVPQAG